MAVVAGSKEVALVPLTAGRTGVEPVRFVRSTLIAASLLGIKSRGHLERYLRHLPRELHDTILPAVAGTWMPLDVGIAHYRAAEALELTIDEQLGMGRDVAERIQNSLLGTLVRVARGAGVTPWTGLEYSPKLWARVLQGGSMAVYRLGPKEARIECHGAPELASIGYFRNGFRGMFAGSGELFCNKLYVHDLQAFAVKRVIGFRVAWA
jgi:hypothetical protein